MWSHFNLVTKIASKSNTDNFDESQKLDPILIPTIFVFLKS